MQHRVTPSFKLQDHPDPEQTYEADSVRIFSDVANAAV